ncbi:MAG: hypothetical protein LIO71_03105 [Ruminococcus sp.]|nr:hypothetical protein [Ruminococcus sp.]
MPRMSVATIDKPEFINLQPLDINPLMSKCEIKVLYVGENRNRSFISKEVATEMAKTLRGAPIVGYYKDDKEDFRDHGDKLTIDSDGFKFESLTKPYGFVAPDAEVWFQKFTDTDDFGNEVEHEYLMTTGYLWTGQYEEAKLPLEEGRPQSMELDENTLDGHWAENYKSGLEFFIINDAIFSKLCILGEDIEPCFEGANVTAPDVSTSFALNDDFTKTLYSMMQQLKFALEGGQSMNEENKTPEVGTEEQAQENFSAEQDKNDETAMNKIENPTEGESQGESSYANSDDDKKKEEDENKSSEEPENDDKDDDDEDKKDEKYSLLQQQYEELQSKFSALEADYQTLVSFKNEVENEKKDELINSFYMLSDEDKKDVVENKSKYTLDEIEAKLSIVYTKKQLAAQSLSNENSKPNVTIYTLGDQDNNTPDWVKAVREVQETL